MRRSYDTKGEAAAFLAKSYLKPSEPDLIEVTEEIRSVFSNRTVAQN